MENPNCRRMNEWTKTQLQHYSICKFSHIGNCLPWITSLRKRKTKKQLPIFKISRWGKILNDIYCFFSFFLDLKETEVKKNLTSLLYCFKTWKSKMATFGEESEIKRVAMGDFHYICLFCNVNVLFCNKNTLVPHVKTSIIYLPIQELCNDGNLMWHYFDSGQIMIPATCEPFMGKTQTDVANW